MNAELKTQEKQVRRKHKKISFLVKHGVNCERYLSCNLIFLIKKKERFFFVPLIFCSVKFTNFLIFTTIILPSFFNQFNYLKIRY